MKFNLQLFSLDDDLKILNPEARIPGNVFTLYQNRDYIQYYSRDRTWLPIRIGKHRCNLFKCKCKCKDTFDCGNYFAHGVSLEKKRGKLLFRLEPSKLSKKKNKDTQLNTNNDVVDEQLEDEIMDYSSAQNKIEGTLIDENDDNQQNNIKESFIDGLFNKDLGSLNPNKILTLKKRLLQELHLDNAATTTKVELTNKDKDKQINSSIIVNQIENLDQLFTTKDNAAKSDVESTNTIEDEQINKSIIENQIENLDQLVTTKDNAATTSEVEFTNTNEEEQIPIAPAKKTVICPTCRRKCKNFNEPANHNSDCTAIQFIRGYINK